MTSKIFRSTVLVAVLVILCCLAVIMGVLYNHFSIVQVNQLKDELSLAVTGTEQYGNAFLENVESDRFRLTWIDEDGKVLFDTQVAADGMANHADREEFREALQTGTGDSTRYSDTQTEKTIYEAKRLKDGTVLRIATSQASAVSLMIGMFYPLALLALVTIALSAILAGSLAKNIVKPINELNLEQPLANNTYEELSPLLRRLNQQHLQIVAQMDSLRRKSDEFKQITDNMQEGLVLLSSETNILSINPAAVEIFDTEPSCVGKGFLHVDRSREMRKAVNDALDNGYGSARAKRNGRDYQFELSRIESDGKVVGAVILAFDITQTLNAEQTRREFSANVSHELKTPLQSIIGSAELLESGVVKPEDTSRFIGHIRKEAARLVDLVEDIIRLSQLDEGVELPVEEVDLFALSQEVAAILETSAGEKDVSVQINAEPCRVKGVRRLLHELVYNLCDNAIKYNRPGGRVEILVREENGHPVLRVSDTGIGIPPEHQDRVFERFYRVDKSHSKESGGTGLGLSIVKHAAAHHGARLRLQSTPGEGTVITVTF